MIISEIFSKIKNIKKDGLKVIFIIGGIISGKTQLAKKIVKTLDFTDFISTDDYVIRNREYRKNNIERKNPLLKYDFKFLNKKIKEISKITNNIINAPTYNQKTGLAIAFGRENYSNEIEKISYLIVERDFNAVEKSDYLIYFHVPNNIRLQNRVNRNTVQRSEYESKKIVNSFDLHQKLQHISYTLPSSKKANITIFINPTMTTNGFVYIYNLYQRK